MVISTTELTNLIGAYLWPLFRVSSLVMVAPIFGTRTVPARVRLMISLAITAAVVPMINTDSTVLNQFAMTSLLIIVQQILIGVLLGFAIHLVFSAVITGGQVIAMQMGLGFSLMVDPQNGAQAPVLSQFYMIMVMLVYLAINGHLVLIEVLVDSFRTMPVSDRGITATNLFQLVSWASHIFAGGMAIALPAIASLLVVNIAFGVMTRSAPQLNIFAIGFPVTMIMGFALAMVTLPGVLPQSITLFNDVYHLLRGITGGL